MLMHPEKKKLELFEAYLKSIKLTGEVEGLNEAITYVMQQKGKRMRPMLCLMATIACKGDIELTLGPATGIELFHNFTLVHDDIMDNAIIRRNIPSVFAKFGRDTAILAGDVLLVKAYSQIGNVDGYCRTEILEYFGNAAIEVCEGQQLDINFEAIPDINLSDYLVMIRKKTAVLLAASLQIGAYIACRNKEVAGRFYEFGIQLGLAFQLQDDLLDAYAIDQKFGKKIGGDIIQNKKTYLLLRAIQDANTEQRVELESLMKKKSDDMDDKVLKVLAVFNQLDIKNKTEQAIKNYYDKAMTLLRGLSDDGYDMQELTVLMQNIKKRDY